ncbi:erythromycin esterase family protein [Kibdelosporangium aridum]|uniref:Erythromycin esterase homolog n=1 Tax=Kibdelosporangium aridum TaxID=2030 RepID=A0A1W2B0I9_KIBAR|nr:erythromycin esterase family protein [Kibdelosporangium aridum]SMC66232.1 Erythromycin esterase homolog [Kibdelosporangium aridum]
MTRHPLRRAIGDAQIVGLGESVHGAAEELILKHRTMRVLVEQMGFRSIAWEDQWTTGLQVDEYIRNGTGDLDTLMSQLGGQWQSRKVADVLRWLRDFNAGRADKVRFAGVEYYLTGLAAYDAIDAYVASTAPERLAELRRHLKPIRPATPDIFDHIAKYQKVPDKQPFIDNARKVRDLVADLPENPAQAITLNHARQIVSFYEHYSLSFADSLVHRDARAAENVKWWRDFSGDKIAYWAASPHTANAPRLRIAVPPDPDWIFPSAGSYLRQWYGHRYLTIGFTFDHGTVRVGPSQTAVMPPPAPDWFEQPLGKTGIDEFVLDLRTPAPSPVRDWLQAPIKTRGLPDRGPGSYMAGGALAQWFDLLVHRQEVTPTLSIQPDNRDQAVVEWINRNAAPLTSNDPSDPLDDLRPLRRIAASAAVVGLGESTHGSREQFRQKHRMVRFLVEHMGFRTFGLEHDFAHGVVLDRYLMTGEGDPRQVVTGMGFPFWISEEMLDLVRWLRSYNETHHDKVRFLGTDVIALREMSFSEITAYVRRIAPDRLAEVERELAPVRPTPGNHVQWYQGLSPEEQRKLIQHARRASDLVQGLPETGSRLEREYAEQHARTIVGWYESFAHFARSERELFIADTIKWWQRTIGGTIVYSAANIHSTAAPRVTFRSPGAIRTANHAGGFLRERLGGRYVSIGMLFGHGAISSDFMRPGPHPILSPPPGILDTTLGKARDPAYMIDLHSRAPGPVRAWRDGPSTMRMIHPSYVDDDDGSGYTMSVDSLTDAFDALVYLRTTTPTRLF